jgi:N6-adenosine-specific RNA methylase IME4
MNAPAATSIFAPLPVIDGGWACALCDPALHFSTYSAKGQGRAPSRHYDTFKPKVLLDLPLQRVVAKHAWLWLWWPDPHILAMREVAEEWGFKFSAKGFTWIKTLETLAKEPRWISTDEIGPMLTMGGGLTTRKNSESCWLWRRGNPKILSKGVREIIVAPRREHSRKPDHQYERIMSFCPGPYLELFARQTWPEWSSWGNQVGLFDEDAA